MFDFISHRDRRPRGARGWRAYVVGDVHGRLDLLEALLGKIHDELDRRPARKTLLVCVGDLIDRGPHSAQVVERLRSLGRRVDYVVYPDEGHGFTKRANAEDAYGRIVDFLTKELSV